MTNLPRFFNYIAQAQAITQTQREKRFKSTTELASELEPNEPSLARPPFPIWQITVPLCIVLIFGIGSLTAYSMVEGRYLFDLSVSREQIRIRTDVDKRENGSTKEEQGASDKRTTNSLDIHKKRPRQHGAIVEFGFYGLLSNLGDRQLCRLRGTNQPLLF